MSYTKTPEHRANISASRKRHIASHADTCLCLGGATRRQNISAALKGRKKTPKHAANLSASLTGRKLSIEHRRELSRIHTGIKFSKRHKARKSQAGKLHMETILPKDCECAAHHPELYQNFGFGVQTGLERKLYELLSSADFNFEKQTRFGRYVVDAWVPSHQLVFEADGSYFHPDGPSTERDEYLLSHGALAVIHLTEEDL